VFVSVNLKIPLRKQSHFHFLFLHYFILSKHSTSMQNHGRFIKEFADIFPRPVQGFRLRNSLIQFEGDLVRVEPGFKFMIKFKNPVSQVEETTTLSKAFSQWYTFHYGHRSNVSSLLFARVQTPCGEWVQLKTLFPIEFRKQYYAADDPRFVKLWLQLNAIFHNNAQLDVSALPVFPKVPRIRTKPIVNILSTTAPHDDGSTVEDNEDDDDDDDTKDEDYIPPVGAVVTNFTDLINKTVPVESPPTPTNTILVTVASAVTSSSILSPHCGSSSSSSSSSVVVEETTTLKRSAPPVLPVPCGKRIKPSIVAKKSVASVAPSPSPPPASSPPSLAPSKAPTSKVQNFPLTLLEELLSHPLPVDRMASFCHGGSLVMQHPSDIAPVVSLLKWAKEQDANSLSSFLNGAGGCLSQI
jgi:hypothetical protein